MSSKMKSYHVVVPFLTKEGEITIGEAIEKSSPEAAKRAVQVLAAQGNGGIAFTRTIDPATGDASDADLILEAGTVPVDWRDMLSE